MCSFLGEGKPGQAAVCVLQYTQKLIWRSGCKVLNGIAIRDSARHILGTAAIAVQWNIIYLELKCS